VYVNGHDQKMATLVLDPRLPDDAIGFMKSNGISGVVFANDNLGGYLLWTAYPDLRPFVDGRQLYPERFFKQVSALKQPHVYWPSLASQYDLKIVLLDLSLPVHYALVYYLSRQPDWQLVYLKKEKVIFVKRGAFGLSEDAQRLEEVLKTQKMIPEDMQRLTSIAAIPVPSGLTNLMRPAPRYNEILEESTTLLGVGFYKAGIAKLIEAYEVTGDVSIPARADLILKEVGRSIPGRI
jgi:hypothetical protein